MKPSQIAAARLERSLLHRLGRPIPSEVALVADLDPEQFDGEPEPSRPREDVLDLDATQAEAEAEADAESTASQGWQKIIAVNALNHRELGRGLFAGDGDFNFNWVKPPLGSIVYPSNHLAKPISDLLKPAWLEPAGPTAYVIHWATPPEGPEGEKDLGAKTDLTKSSRERQI